MYNYKENVFKENVYLFTFFKLNIVNNIIIMYILKKLIITK